MPHNLKRSKQLKQSYYDNERAKDGFLEGNDFWCYKVPCDAQRIERDASICRLIPQIAWIIRMSLSPYDDYFERNENNEIVDIKEDKNKFIKKMLVCVLEYIDRGWLPADQSTWDDLMYKLMDEDTENVFSEPY